VAWNSNAFFPGSNTKTSKILSTACGPCSIRSRVSLFRPLTRFYSMPAMLPFHFSFALHTSFDRLR
jgi:hypothetical protein